MIAEAPGYEALSRSLVVTAGSEVDLLLALEKPDRPITRRWWFIPAVVGAAVVAGGAVYLATRGEPTSSLPGIICDATGCRPGGP